MAARSSTWSWVSMPSEAATSMSTASLIARTPSRICSISRSSGPRTAATMQNSLAPVAAVCSAALTSSGMFSHTERTGEVNWPLWLQKWQSSGQPPVLSETMPSTSTSGPHQRIRTSCASASRSGSTSSPVRSTSRTCASSSGTPAVEHLLARNRQDVGPGAAGRARGYLGGGHQSPRVAGVRRGPRRPVRTGRRLTSNRPTLNQCADPGVQAPVHASDRSADDSPSQHPAPGRPPPAHWVPRRLTAS